MVHWLDRYRIMGEGDVQFLPVDGERQDDFFPVVGQMRVDLHGGLRSATIGSIRSIPSRPILGAPPSPNVRENRFGAPPGKQRHRLHAEITRCLESEIVLARQLLALVREDSRIGFEPSCQYFYVPLDLVEKVVNCRWLLGHFVIQ